MYKFFSYLGFGAFGSIVRTKFFAVGSLVFATGCAQLDQFETVGNMRHEASQLTAVSEKVFYQGGPMSGAKLYAGVQNNWLQKVKHRGKNLGAVQLVRNEEFPGERVYRVSFKGLGQVYLQTKRFVDLEDFLEEEGVLSVDMIVHEYPTDNVILRLDCGWPCHGTANITRPLMDATLEKRFTLKVPIECFAATGAQLDNINSPFLVTTSGKVSFSFDNVVWRKNALEEPDVFQCF